MMPVNVFGDYFSDFQQKTNDAMDSFRKKMEDDQEEFRKKNCGIDVGFAASDMWDGTRVDTDDNKYKQAVKSDTFELNKYKQKLKNILNGSESNKLTNTKCTAETCKYKCNNLYATCKNGELLKTCGNNVWKCFQTLYIENEYKINMIKKVCPEMPERDKAISVMNADITNILKPETKTNSSATSTSPTSAQKTKSSASKSAAAPTKKAEKTILTAQENKLTVTEGDRSAYKDYDPEAASKQNEADKARQRANKEYAAKLADKNSWVEVEAHEPMRPESTDNGKVAQSETTMDFMAAQTNNANSTFAAQRREEQKQKTAAPAPKRTVNDEKSTAPESVQRSKQEILASVGNLKIGDSITYNDSDYKKYLEPAIKEWKTACAAIVGATYPNAVSDPESAPAGTGKSKMTCYIKTCGNANLELSSNRKSCVKTKEQQKLEKEYDKQIAKNEKQNAEIEKVVSDIKAASFSVSIGSSVSIPTKFFDANEQVTNDDIDNAFSVWEQKCDKIRTSEITSTTFDEKKIAGNYKFTCIISRCDETKGLKPSDDGKSCVKTKEQQKLEKEYNKQTSKNEKQNAEIEKIIKAIEASAENINIGSSITIPSDLITNDKIDTAVSEWETACGNLSDKEKSVVSNDPTNKGGKTVFTCLIQTCKQSGYEPSSDKKSCIETAEEKQRKKEQELENQTEKCIGRDGTWDDKKGCLCDGKKMKDDDSLCVPDKSKEACKTATDADWKINKCVCKDKNLAWSNQDLKCVKKSGECKDSYFGRGEYDENGKCIITKCTDEKNYTLNESKNKCELKTTANIRDKNQQNKQDKDFSSDVAKFISAFNYVVNTKKTEYCEAQKQTESEQQGDQA